MISSKTNMAKSLTMKMVLFALPLFVVTGLSSIIVNAAGSYPMGDMQSPPAITEIFPDAANDDNDEDLSNKINIVDSHILGASSASVPVETGDHYKYLSDAEKVAYDALYRAIISKNYIPYSQKSNVYSYSYLNTYKTLVYSGTSTFQSAYGLSSADYTNVLNRASEALYFDHPDRIEFYMCHPSHFWTVSENDMVYSYIVLYAGYDETRFEAIDKQIKTSLTTWISELKKPENNCVDGKWDAVTELKVHDYYVNNIKYDRKCATDSSSAGYFNLAHTAYGSLCSKFAVCDGYAAGFELILEKLGIDTMIIAGYARGGHAWNIVRLDEEWYEVDTTWAYIDEKNISHDWFNRTTVEFESGLGDSSKAHERRKGAAYVGFRMPKAYGTHYTYKYLTGSDENSLQKDETNVAVEGISLSQTSAELQIDQSITLNPIFTPENATNKEYSISSNNGCVAINGNTIVAKSAGTATVTVTSKDGGFSAQCAITVKEPQVLTVEALESKEEEKNEIIIDDGSVNGIFVITSRDNATVTYHSGCRKNISEIIIPSTVSDENGCVYTVTEIASNALKGYKKLKKISVPGTINKIGKGAFKNCKKLSAVKINGRNLDNVSSGAFKGIKKGAKIAITTTGKRQYNRLVKLIKRAGAADAAFKMKTR